MPWCPKCRNEYREGITTCADCGVELVEDLSVIDDDVSNYESLFITKDINLAGKFAAYMEYSGLSRYTITDNNGNEITIESEDVKNDTSESDTSDIDTSEITEASGNITTEAEYDSTLSDSDTEYTIHVHPSDYETARKLYHGFALTESAEQARKEQSCHNESDNTDSAAAEASADYIEADTDDNLSDHDIVTDIDTDADINAYDSDELEEISPDHPDIIEPDEIIGQYEDDESEVFTASSTYVRKADRYREYRSSAYTCMICGVLGIIFTVLNMLQVFNMFANTFSQIVMLVMFSLFFFGGIYLIIKSNTIKSGIADEEAVENRVNTWLSINVTSNYINGLKFENVEDEVNYLNYCKTIRENILKDIPEAPADMVDTLVEDYMSKYEEQ